MTDEMRQSTAPGFLGIDRLVGKEAYTGYFPLHEVNHR